MENEPKDRTRSADPMLGIAERLTSAGLTPRSVEALLALDTTMFSYHRRIAKADLPLLLMRRIGVDLEIAQFQALTAIARIIYGVGRLADAATIGLIAEEMNLDPSRASRIVSELVTRGLVMRAAAQDDGRKSVILLSPQGGKIMRAFRDEKWKVWEEVFSGWTEAELTSFSTLFDKFIRGSLSAAQDVPSDHPGADVNRPDRA